MRIQRFEWGADAEATGAGIRARMSSGYRQIDLAEIEDAVATGGDRALAELTARYDATELRWEKGQLLDGQGRPWHMEVPRQAQEEALRGLDEELRVALETAVANVGAVAEAQVSNAPVSLRLPQGQQVTVREVPVAAAGIYAPGGLAAYPSSLIMGAVPARVAGVRRVVVCTPPGPDGRLPRAVLAAAALCRVDELYAVGGAQAIFAMARGTETIGRVDVIAGPGSARVQEAKRRVFGEVGIDSIAGPSELMVIADREARPEWLALDLCAQAEHGGEGLLLVASPDDELLSRIEEAVLEAAGQRPGLADALLGLVRVPGMEEAVALSEAVAPEHLQLDCRDAGTLAGRITTAGCVFTGSFGATAFGDYIAGSNHVLPTDGAGRFCGPLGPSVFRRRISNVEIDADAAALLAPLVDRLSREEGLPVHGESARARLEPRQEAGPAD